MSSADALARGDDGGGGPQNCRPDNFPLTNEPLTKAQKKGMKKDHDAVCPDQLMGLVFADTYEWIGGCKRVCDYSAPTNQHGQMRGTNCINPKTCAAWKDHGFTTIAPYCQKSSHIEGDGTEELYFSVPLCDETTKNMPPVVYPNPIDPWGFVAAKEKKRKALQAAKEQKSAALLAENANKFHVSTDPTSLLATVTVEPDFFQHDFVIVLFAASGKNLLASPQHRNLNQSQSADIPMSGRPSGMYRIELRSKKGDRLGQAIISLDAASVIEPTPEENTDTTGTAK